MRLDRIVEDLERHRRRRHLDHRDFLLRCLIARLVHHVGGLEAQQPRHLDIDPRLGDALFPHRMIGDALAERSEEHTSELQYLMRISYAAFCLKKKTNNDKQTWNSRSGHVKPTLTTKS